MFLVELPNDAKSITQVKVDGQSVDVAQFAYDALLVPLTPLSLRYS